MAKQHGTSIEVGTNGRFVIPIGIRRLLGINDNDTLGITIDESNRTITLQKNTAHCCLCHSTENLKILNPNQYMCEACIKQVKNKDL